MPTRSVPHDERAGKTGAAPTDDVTYAYAQGLPEDVTGRLLAGRFTRDDLRLYYQTEHFQQLKTAVIETYGGCVWCGSRCLKNLTVHHRHYRTLYFEDPLKDVSAACRRCHSRHHRRK